MQGSTVTVHLSEATLSEMENETMEQSEAEQILNEMMDLINGPEAPDDVVCFDAIFLPTVLSEILERVSEYESRLEEIREKTY